MQEIWGKTISSSPPTPTPPPPLLVLPILIWRRPLWSFKRLNKSTKRCLRIIVGQARLLYDELLTDVTEVEAILNSHPLSYVSSDDLEEPLTPSHLLVGRRLLNLPDNLCYQEDINDDEFEIDPAKLSKRARHLNNVINHFWNRWRREYLFELREAHCSNQEGSTTTSVSVGDIVLLHDEGPRGFWKLAKIQTLITGKLGELLSEYPLMMARSRCCSVHCNYSTRWK